MASSCRQAITQADATPENTVTLLSLVGFYMDQLVHTHETLHAGSSANHGRLLPFPWGTERRLWLLLFLRTQTTKRNILPIDREVALPLAVAFHCSCGADAKIRRACAEN